VPELLDALAVAHGVHVTEQISLRFDDLSRIGALMARLRENPPTELAGGPVTSEDLLPGADVFRLRGEGLRVVVRPSGTEPKLKAYLEIVTPVTGQDNLADAKSTAAKRLAGLSTEVSALLS
jgi:phosphomannomutase